MELVGTIRAQGMRLDRSSPARGGWLHACFAFLAAGLNVPCAAASDFKLQPPALEFTVGAFGVLDGADDSLRVGGEYRFPPRGRLRLSPGLGMSFAGDRSSYIYADLRRDVWIDSRWVVHVSFGAGRFTEDQVLRPGGELEFQSSLGVARQLANGWRIGVLVQHLSNGSLFDENPGT